MSPKIVATVSLGLLLAGASAQAASRPSPLPVSQPQAKATWKERLQLRVHLAASAWAARAIPPSPEAEAAFHAGLKTANVLSAALHFGLDGYGDGQTPFVGREVAGFAVHHERPRLIAKDSMAHLAALATPATISLALVSKLAKTPRSKSFWLGVSSGLALAPVMHRLAHTLDHERTPAQRAAVEALGEVLPTPAEHMGHHRAPHARDFDIGPGTEGRHIMNQIWPLLASLVVEVGGPAHRSFPESANPAGPLPASEGAAPREPAAAESASRPAVSSAAIRGAFADIVKGDLR